MVESRLQVPLNLFYCTFACTTLLRDSCQWSLKKLERTSQKEWPSIESKLRTMLYAVFDNCQLRHAITAQALHSSEMNKNDWRGGNDHDDREHLKLNLDGASQIKKRRAGEQSRDINFLRRTKILSFYFLFWSCNTSVVAGDGCVYFLLKNAQCTMITLFYLLF